MSDTFHNTGSCLCGQVKFTVTEMKPQLGACHCGMCRKWGGGPNMAVDCGTSVTFESEENIVRYQSSEWAERGFCKQCGTHLFYCLKQAGQYIVPVGLFDNQNHIEFDHQIFIDRKPAYYEFANQTHNMTEQEVMDQYFN